MKLFSSAAMLQRLKECFFPQPQRCSRKKGCFSRWTHSCGCPENKLLQRLSSSEAKISDFLLIHFLLSRKKMDLLSAEDLSGMKKVKKPFLSQHY
jgi:hypothetical protein